jgi:hypothetical protein
MSAQIARDQHFPASCKRCGGVLYDVVDFCPYCGTSRPLDTVALGTLPKATLSALGPTAAAPPVAAAAGLSPADESASDPASAFPDEDSPPARQTPFWEPRRWFSKGFLLVWFVIPIGYAAYQLLGEGSKPAAPVSEPSVHETGGSISQPEQQANVTPPAANTAPAIHETPQFADLNESLQAARASLAENNLSGAAAADNAALSRDPNNEDARSIQRDLQAREQRRDNALQIADRCAGEGTWSCTQTEASEALAIDSSSKHAQSLMERSILAKGWTPLSSPNAPKDAAKAPANANSTDVAGANANANMSATNHAATASASVPASNGNSADAQEQAIVQYGWKHAAPTGAAH